MAVPDRTIANVESVDVTMLANVVEMNVHGSRRWDSRPEALFRSGRSCA